MIILCLGTNEGDRLNHLRLAYQQLKTIPHFKINKVSAIYESDALLPDNSETHWNKPYLNCAIGCETTLEPEVLLQYLKNIESNLGRTPSDRFAPRIIDIDILAWNDRCIKTDKLTIPHEGLKDRPFALWPLADLAPFWQYPDKNNTQKACELVKEWGSRFTGAAPLRTKQINHRIDIPKLVGVLNITPDSFSDGGKYLPIENALSHIEQLFHAGADIIDIGAESTRPNATPISSQMEWERLEPLLKAFNAIWQSKSFKPALSIDTRYPDVAKKALELGIDMINDVSGGATPAMLELIGQYQIPYIFMHNLGIPENRTHSLPLGKNFLKIILDWAKEKMDTFSKYGIRTEQLIFDPGIGFGKTAEQSAYLIHEAQQFQQLGVPLLFGHSRKSFYGNLSPRPASERDLESAVTSIYLANAQVDYLRVHNIDATARTLKISKELTNYYFDNYHKGETNDRHQNTRSQTK